MLGVQGVGVRSSFRYLSNVRVLVTSHVMCGEGHGSLPSHLFCHPSSVQRVLPQYGRVSVIHPLFLRFRGGLRRPFQYSFFSHDPLYGQLVLAGRAIRNATKGGSNSQAFYSTSAQFFPRVRDHPYCLWYLYRPASSDFSLATLHPTYTQARRTVIVRVVVFRLFRLQFLSGASAVGCACVVSFWKTACRSIGLCNHAIEQPGHDGRHRSHQDRLQGGGIQRMQRLLQNGR